MQWNPYLPTSGAGSCTRWEADTPSPYPDEFIEVSLREVSDSRTEMTFLNGWGGEPIGDEGIEAAKAGWSQWFDMLEASLAKPPERGQ
jgi:hypothetical protein